MMGLPVLDTEQFAGLPEGRFWTTIMITLWKRGGHVFLVLCHLFFSQVPLNFLVFFNTFETLRSCTLEHVAQVSYRVHLLTCWVVPFLQAKQAGEKKMIRATCNVGKYSILALQCILYFRQISLVSCFHARGSIWMKARPLEKQPGVVVWGVLENNPCGKNAQYL